jgi:anionic cell wall polymer biosynthesis LytR-Cps2A-Psr (LCP) family protein
LEIRDYNGYKKPVSSAKKTAKQPVNKNRRAIKALIAVFCVLVAGVIAIGIYFIARWKGDDYSSLQSGSLVVLAPEPNVTASDDNARVNEAPTPTPVQTTIEYNGSTYAKNDSVVNLVFLGIDSNSDRKKLMMGYRSDMVMVCAVDIASKKATLLSIPRDTSTTMYEIDGSGNIKKTTQNKINAAFSLGGDSFEIRAANSMACVEMFLERRCELNEPLNFELDVPVYLYAAIDMDGIPKVASAVGGVEVTLTESVPSVGRKGETVLLKGQKAVDFITNRKNTGGDEHRAARQQQFMIALAKKIKSMGPVDMILSLYDELQKYVWTNLSTDQMIDFAKVLTKTNIDSIDIRMVTGEGKTTGGTYYMYHDEEATLQMLLDIYYTKVS